MSWLKFDDKAPRHPKIAALTDRAFRWWVKGLCYASEFLTDGVLHPIFWKQVPKADRAQLSGQRLWDWADPNFLIHDYQKHQTLKEEVEADRERNRQNAKAYRERRREERRKNSRPSPAVTDDASPTNHRPVIAESPTQRTDNREQIQRTENREQRTEGVPSAPRPQPLIARSENINWAKKHGYHVTGFCDWVCLDEQQAAEFAAKIPGDDHALKVKQIKAWALDIRRQWADRIIPDGSNFDFWRNRWTETHGGSRPANATLKAAKAAADLDEAFR